MHGPITNPGAHLGQTFGVGIRVGLCRAISSSPCRYTFGKQVQGRLSIKVFGTSLNAVEVVKVDDVSVLF
ncbi:hypothetical protein DPMN_178305 [Dreissena polymorpha]|uniref:Uncharacterized protein n=1 Tax=Dreissena polymorpha TaxID=45954 RepID=A0A9D4IIJ7_DREPO|nr:hypothetical protein DPMN_178305 [Dreissena polymorpha]